MFTGLGLWRLEALSGSRSKGGLGRVLLAAGKAGHIPANPDPHPS